MRHGARILVGLALALAGAPGAGAAELVTIETGSRHVDPARASPGAQSQPRELRANVLLPDRYDGRRRFPVLYLLHGVGDSYADWASPGRGDVASTAAGLDAVIVMPEAARGFYSNWWNGGRRADPGWERHYLDELIPLVEERFRILPGRRWHAIAGFSMGGTGSTLLASRRPGYFGSAATFHGFVSIQRPEVPLGLPLVGGVAYRDIFGAPEGFYATGHNPMKLTDNLRSTRLYVTVGDGTPAPGVASEPAAIVGGGAVEAALKLQAEDLVSAARESGVDVTYRPLQGVHDWPYRRRHLRDAIDWGLFEPVPERPARWIYRTVAQTGEMWGLRFRFSAPPDELITFRLRGASLSGSGSGQVSIENDAGCGFTAELPFERELPREACRSAQERIRLSVTPRRARLHEPTSFRFRATTTAGVRRVAVASARIRFGRSTARTNRRGRATIRRRLTRRGVHRPRAAKAGLLPGSARVRGVR